jgi:hypothetical protein
MDRGGTAKKGWPAMRAGALMALVLCVGCGGGGVSADSDETAIRAVLEQLRTAQDDGNAELACREVYVIREPERPGTAAESEATATAEGGAGDPGEEGAAGLDACETAFEKADAARRAGVSDLRTEIGEIDVTDDAATAIVHTELVRSDGSRLSQDVPYDLVRTPDGWRVRIAEEG